MVRRTAGDLMARWEVRWANSLVRYQALSCVKLILPWSTPGMRFCTSEMKTDVICAEMSRRFPGRAILSVTGIRHQESPARAKMPISQRQPKLSRRNATGWNWHPIIEWSTDEVFAYLAAKGVRLHEAYTRYGCSRVSCTFCIMGSAGDLQAAAMCADNADIYRLMVDLEIRSTFAFQGSRWLGDVAPHLLSAETRERLADAKWRARVRAEAEATIPKRLWYTSGWPTCLPSQQEADLLGRVRRTVAKTVGIVPTFTDPVEIIARYQALYVQRTKAQGKQSRGDLQRFGGDDGEDHSDVRGKTCEA